MLDLIIIGIIVITTITGARVGLVKTIYQLLSSVLALVLAFFIYPLIEATLKITPIYTNIQEWVRAMLPDIGEIGLQAQAQLMREKFSWMPEFVLNKMIENNNSEVYNLLGVSNLIEYIVMFITQICVMAISLILCFILIKIGLMIFVNVLDLVAKLPVLKLANKWGGVIAGFVKGVLIVWIMCLMLPLLTMIPQFMALEKLVAESFLLQLFYQNNIILEAIVNLKL